LTSELLVDKAMELRYVGGVFAGNIKPTPFLCLILKMLQIQPQKDIIIEFIRNEDFKYVRALGAYYMRLTGTSTDCFKYLEPLLNDYRKVRKQDREGNFHLFHMDEFVDSLLREDRVCDVQLPRLQKRHVLEENNQLEPRVSLLEADDFDLDDEDDEDEDEDFEEKKRIAEMLDKAKQASKDDRRERSRRSRSRSRSRDRDRKRRRSRSRERESSRRHRSRSRDRDSRRSDHHRSSKSDRKDRDRSHKDHGKRDHRDREPERERGGGSKDSMSVEETNKMRAALELAPLK